MKKVVLCLIVFLCWTGANAQSADSLLLGADPVLAELDSILNSPDSTSILDLIDSILMAPTNVGSQLAVRVGYNNNIVANGTSSVSQFGLTAGTAYYHKSGAYVDVTSYYSDEFKPSLYLTVGALGYLNSFTKYYSLMAEYDHYFYTPAKDGEDTYTPYTNNLYISNYFKVNKFVFRFDYNMYFGEKVAHRFTPGVGLNLSKKNWLGFDKITLLPSAALWYGSDTVSEWAPNFTTRRERLLLILQGKPRFSLHDRMVWGIVNYTVSCPVSFLYKNWSLLISYNLNFQKGLPGESVESYRTGYFGASLVKYFDLK